MFNVVVSFVLTFNMHFVGLITSVLEIQRTGCIRMLVITGQVYFVPIGVAKSQYSQYQQCTD